MHETDAWREAGFQVYYSGDPPVVEYIELSGRHDHQVLYHGVSVFETDADLLVSHISRDAPFDPDDGELGYSYIFPALQLSLWRPVLPQSPDDTQGRKFKTIGVGRKGYYSRRA